MDRVEEGATVEETAIFRSDDAPCLVDAALACSACLSGDVEWTLAGSPWEREARCRCRACGHERSVALTPEQALRLSLHSREGRDAAPEPHAALAAIV